MIRELRIRHRWTFVALALLLPIGFGVALASRTSVPANPRELQGDASAMAPEGVLRSDSVLRQGTIELRLRTWDEIGAGARTIELTPLLALELPDVLVYWADSTAAGELPSNGVLLGALAGVRPRTFRWHPSDPSKPGRLYLYSLARQELAASFEVPR